MIDKNKALVSPKNTIATTEKHVLIIWPNSIQYEEEIINEFTDRFEIINRHVAKLDLNGNKWLEIFYSRSLVHFSNQEKKIILTDKRKRIGSGEAIIMELLINNPRYDLVSTTNGISYVNLDCQEIKKKIRDRIKCEIHLSDSAIDSRDNQYNLRDFIKTHNLSDIKPVSENSIKDFFATLNAQNISYVSLRGHNLINNNQSLLSDHKKDIDILVDIEDFNKLKRYHSLVKLSYEKEERYTLVYTEQGKHRDCKIDIYTTKSGVLPPKFEQKILSEAVLTEGIKSLTKKNRDFYDLYHFVFQKRFIPENKLWGDDDFRDVVLKRPTDIIAFLNENGLGDVLKNNYYPKWKTFPAIHSLNRKLIQKKLQATINDRRYYTYVFENQNGDIEKEGELECIKNEYEILNLLKRDLYDTIPQPIEFSFNTDDNLGILKMTKVNGRPLTTITNMTWGFKTFKRHLESAIKTLLVLETNKVLHRDINPSNLFYTEDKIIFIDFGWSVIKGKEHVIPTPEGLNSGFYKHPDRHDDRYSLIKCFMTKYIFPTFLKKVLLSYDTDIILKEMNSLSITKKIIIELFLRNQGLLHLILSFKKKYI